MYNQIRKKGHRVAPTSTINIRKVASIVRDALGHPTGAINVQNLIEKVLPEAMPGFYYDVLEVDEMGEDNARTYPHRKLIEIRKDVYEGMCRKNGRDLFTVAHEVGHLFLHRGAVLARGWTDHKIFEDSEWQADTFAAEFLMPYEECRLCGSPEEIVARYGVSYTAAKKRFNDVNKK